MNSRCVAAMPVLTTLALTNGCTGLPTDEETLTFEPEPATADATVAENAGYETNGAEAFAVNHTLSFGGQECQVAASSHTATYEKTLDLSFFGEAKLGSFSVISAPVVKVAGQLRSPIGDYSGDDLIRLVGNWYQSLSDVGQVSSQNVQMLGQTVNITKYSATVRFDGDEVDVYVHVMEVQYNEDFAVATGLYPQQLNGEEENVLELIHSVRRPSKAWIALASCLGGAFFPSPRISGSMTRIRTTGITVTALGAVGYGVGTLTTYPGRAFSVAAVVVGITLWAIGGDVR